VKNIIYSIYIENKEPNLSEKHQFTKTQLEKHYEKLVDVKKEYAKHCNAEYRVYNNDTYYQKFKKKFDGFEFDIINLYKIYLWEELGKEYDNVLYLDLDVIPNTTENFFETFDMNKICVYSPNATKENVWTKTMLKNYKKNIHSFEYLITKTDKYNEYVKAMCKRAMLAIDNKFNTDYLIANTAILGGNSSAISKLRYTERLDEMSYTLKKAKEEQFFGETISKLFFANNEIFVHYLLDKDNIDWYNLPKEWHTYLMKNDKITSDLKSVKMIHLINKRFEELWNVI
jgi:hypothetical protein|tara:strand:- start:1331 stop:2188 length:858 start_codon:yes stop_codon:yes gene_type:complete